MGLQLLLPIAGWTAAAAGTAAAGTAVASPTLLREFPGLKDELGWSLKDAAKEEYNQRDSGRGYNVEDGTIKRTFFEKLRDKFVGNTDYTKMTEEAQELHKKTLALNNKDVADLNSRLKALKQPTIEFTPTTTQAEITAEVTEKKRKVPLLEAIKALNDGSLDGMSVDTDQGTLAGAVDDAKYDKGQNRYKNSQEYLDMQRQQNLTNQLAIGQLSLSEQRNANQMTMAMMDNQLERRRQDSADRRADRKDRQAMIMQMMQGLSALGTSIAI